MFSWEDQTIGRVVGRRIDAPQGTLHGFRDRERVDLPPPFGSRSVLNFESPDFDLLPERLGAGRVSVKVGFELSLVNWMFQAFATLAPPVGGTLLPVMGRASGMLRWIGSASGIVTTELFWADGRTRHITVMARENAQRMAALPCVDVLGAEGLLEQLAADGLDVIRGEVRAAASANPRPRQTR